MNPNITEHLREEFAAAIAREPQPIPSPLIASPWIAMSVLQKAIRRGNENLALSAAASLMLSSPERLWRRIGSVAFEDIGLGDLSAAVAATTALTGKRFRAGLGGEWHVASQIVTRLTRANKCRAADDILMFAELHPSLSEARREMASLPQAALLDIIRTPDRDVRTRALALWFAIGTDRRPSPHLAYRRGDPETAFDALLDLGCPLSLVQAAEVSLQKVGEVLAPFTALLFQEHRANPEVEDDDLPPECLLQHGVPSWALDVYSREGKRSLAEFLKRDTSTSRWLIANLPEGERGWALGHALFRIEGGLVSRRLNWDLGRELRHQLDVECFPGTLDGGALLAALRSDLGELNEVRSHAL